MTLGTKLIILFSLMTVLFMGFSLYVRSDMVTLKQDITRYRNIQEEIQSARDLQLDVLSIWQFLTDASLTKDRSVISNKAKPRLDAARKSAAEIIEMNRDEPNHLKLVEDIDKGIDRMWSIGNRMFDAYSEDMEDGNTIMAEYGRISAETIETMKAIIDDIQARDSDLINKMHRMIGKSLSVITGIIISGIIIGSGIILFLKNLHSSITGPLAMLVRASAKISSGSITWECALIIFMYERI